MRNLQIKQQDYTAHRHSLISQILDPLSLLPLQIIKTEHNQSQKLSMIPQRHFSLNFFKTTKTGKWLEAG